MAVGIPKGDSWAVKGVWKRGLRDGVPTATMSCPGCGKVCSLSEHEIDDEGHVKPSVVCPYECGFHEYIQLEEWRA